MRAKESRDERMAQLLGGYGAKDRPPHFFRILFLTYSDGFAKSSMTLAIHFAP
jgi:hypothetical protein